MGRVRPANCRARRTVCKRIIRQNFGVPKEMVGPDVQKHLLDEARLLLENAQAACRKVLNEKRDRLSTLAETLLGAETLSGAALKSVLAGQ